MHNVTQAVQLYYKSIKFSGMKKYYHANFPLSLHDKFQRKSGMQKLCNQVCDIAKEAGAFISSEHKNLTTDSVENKGEHDYVTYVDKTAERMIIARLSLLLPEAGFIAEENTESRRGEVFNWIIDPLDGTTNYIHGLAPYAVSIALQQNKEIILGVVYVITSDECFYAWKGSKAYLNDKEIRVSHTDNVQNSLIATGFPYSDYSLLDKYMQLFEYFLRNSGGLRRLGSAATDLVYVACGRMDAFFEYGLKPWDVAAGSFIVQQAGGCNVDFKGGSNFLFGKEIISCNRNMYNEFVNICKNMLS